MPQGWRTSSPRRPIPPLWIRLSQLWLVLAEPARASGPASWSECDPRRGRNRVPQLALKNLSVEFGFTGIVGGPEGVSSEALNTLVPRDADADVARSFWWATIVRAAARAAGEPAKLSGLVSDCLNWETRETSIAEYDRRLRAAGKVLLVVYDALDTVATTWPRRRLLTEALFEVVWAMRRLPWN